MAGTLSETSREERNMAALAETLGIVAALPVWLWWRGRSAFVRFHAVQSMAFDGLTLGLMVGIAAMVIGAAVAGDALLQRLPGENRDLFRLFALAVCTPALAGIGLLAVGVGALLLRLRAAIAANEGRLFCYPLLRDLTARPGVVQSKKHWGVAKW